MKKRIISIAGIVILIAITFYVILSSSDMVAFPKLIHMLNPIHLVVSIGFMLIYMLLNGLIIYIIAREITDQITFKGAFYLGAAGHYYSSITPFASGGQPVQVMLLKRKYDVSIPKGTSITVKKFILYQVVLSFIALIACLYRLKFMLLTYTKPMIIWIFIGLAIHILISIGIILLAYTDKHIKAILNFLLTLAHKFKLFKKITAEYLNVHLDEYVANIGDIKKNKKTMFGLFMLTFVQIMSMFLMTYFVYLALGQSGAGVIDLVCVQVMVYMVSSVIPTPGNVGASEGGFYVLLQPFFPTKLIVYAMIIWRVLTFYGLMLMSGVILLGVKLYDTITNKAQKRAKSE